MENFLASAGSQPILIRLREILSCLRKCFAKVDLLLKAEILKTLNSKTKTVMAFDDLMYFEGSTYYFILKRCPDFIA